MKVQMELDLKPFQIPNYVLAGRTVPGADETKFAIEDLPADAIYALVSEFERAVYKKANVSPRAQPANVCRKCRETI
jgi:hypothetical protein